MTSDRTLVIALFIVGFIVLTLIGAAGHRATAQSVELPHASQTVISQAVIDEEASTCLAVDIAGTCREFELSPLVITPGPDFDSSAPRS